MTPSTHERILVVENDPEISDLIARQALQAAGYQTVIVSDVNTAISRAIQVAPDAVLVDLKVPGLSGKDLLVAFSSQGIQTPVIVLSQQGSESDIIEAFRLGASDYLPLPVREAEVINVVERVLQQVRERRERERLSRQLQQTNQELQLRVRELTTIFSLGKAVTSVTDQALLFDKILEGAIKITQADLGWFLLKEDNSRAYILVAYRNLPASFSDRLNQTWDDGISSLVSMSGETLSIHGEPLRRFKIFSMGQSAMIVPIKVQRQVIGLLVVMRKKPLPFSASEQNLLEAVVDYAAISLVNARLFKAVEERAQNFQALVEHAQAGEKITNELLQNVKNELRIPLDEGRESLEHLARANSNRLTADQRECIDALQEQYKTLSKITEAITPLQIAHTAQRANLNELASQAAIRYQPYAQQKTLTITTDLPANPLTALADPGHVTRLLDGLLCNAIKYAKAGGQLVLHVNTSNDHMAHIEVAGPGIDLDARQVSHLFDADFHPNSANKKTFTGLSISLPVMKEVVNTEKGKIWAESKANQGVSLHLTLPMAK